MSDTSTDWHGGRVLLYIHTYISSGHFWVDQIVNFSIFFFLGGEGVQQKYFLGYEYVVDIFGANTKLN